MPLSDLEIERLRERQTAQIGLLLEAIAQAISELREAVQVAERLERG